MRFPIVLLLFCFHFTILDAYAQGKALAAKMDRHPTYYKLDKLPSRWFSKPKVLEAIDNILPYAIAQLKNARSCLHCKADYTLSLKIDTVYIQSQVDYKTALVEEGGLPYAFSQDESRVSFTYASKHCVRDSTGQEVAQLVITEGAGETYHVQQGNFQKPGRVQYAPLVFMETGRVVLPGQVLKVGALLNGPPLGTVPTEDEVIDITAGKLLTISKWISNIDSQD